MSVHDTLLTFAIWAVVAIGLGCIISAILFDRR